MVNVVIFQMLKEDIQKEYKEKISQIEEEKQKALKDSALIAKEKASTHSLKQEIEVKNTSELRDLWMQYVRNVTMYFRYINEI